MLGLAGQAAAISPGGLGGGEDVSVSIWRVLAALVICAIVALLAVLMIRKRAAGGLPVIASLPARSRRIQVVETRRLSPHADISLVREGGREYLVLLFAGGSQILRSEPAEGTADAQP